MDLPARVTSKGQVTIPKEVRDALGIGQGDSLLFRVVGEGAVIAKAPDLLDLAGSIPLPPDLRGLSWKEIQKLEEAAIEEGWTERSRRR
ncbi:MAG: AbrB/MazE/SpoVT family DNA-binding domain-containing protein [Actinomycetota bacterium]